jgi:hypothetical protein
MEIKQIESLGQTQTEEQKKQQQEKIIKLMLNPTQEAEKALIGASSCQHLFKYVSPIEQEEALSRKHNQKLLDESLQRFAQQQQAHEQMLMRVQLKAMALHEAQKPTQQGNDKQQVKVDTGIGSHKPEKRQNQLHLLIMSIDKALSQPKRPTAQQVWNEIQHRHETYDTSNIIQEVNGTHISWCSGYGNEQTQSRNTFNKTLSKIRNTPPL